MNYPGRPLLSTSHNRLKLKFQAVFVLFGLFVFSTSSCTFSYMYGGTVGPQNNEHFGIVLVVFIIVKCSLY